MAAADPVCTDPDKYQVIFENDRVRVLEYRDLPGGKTLPHQHPDSVMYTLSGFQRRLHAGQGARDVAMEAGGAHWLPAQTHAGENIGTTPTHVLFIELKDAGATGPAQHGGTSHKSAGGSPPPTSSVLLRLATPRTGTSRRNSG
jgi:hypothetical protein